MSDAKVLFSTLDGPEGDAEPGQEQRFGFQCPMGRGRCYGLLIAGRTKYKRDGQNQNGGVAMWDWDGDREAPTFTPSINCKGCWHGYIVKGRCINTQRQDEKEPGPKKPNYKRK